MEHLLRELIAERYGAKPLRAAPPPAAVASDGGPDTELACARRRRILCESLDEPVAAGGFGRRAAA